MLKLDTLLDDMDVPVDRKTDLRWLSRNLGIRNSSHPKFEQAIRAIKEELKREFREGLEEKIKKFK